MYVRDARRVDWCSEGGIECKECLGDAVRRESDLKDRFRIQSLHKGYRQCIASVNDVLLRGLHGDKDLPVGLTINRTSPRHPSGRWKHITRNISMKMSGIESGVVK